MFLTRLALGLGRFFADGEAATENETEVKGLLKQVQDLIFGGWVRALILGGVALFAVIRGVMIGIAIVQAADNEQEKAKAIKGLKTLIIGVAIVLVLYFAAGAIINVISRGF